MVSRSVPSPVKNQKPAKAGGTGPVPKPPAKPAATASNQSEARSSVSGNKLPNELRGQQISQGHGYEKHVLGIGNGSGKNEFADLGIVTREQYAKHIEYVINNPTSIRYHKDGRKFYIHEPTKTVITMDPNSSDGGSAFRPDSWENYIDRRVPKRTLPY